MVGAQQLRVLAALPALVIAVISVGELWSATHYGDDAPASDDWRRVDELLAERHRPGELIVFAPQWIDPLGRHYLGDRMDLPMVARMDAARYPVIWEVSTREHRAPETRGLRATGDWSFGPLKVRRFEQEPAEIVFDFTDSLGLAEVRGRAVGRPKVSLEEVAFAPHRCIRVETRPGQEVVLSFTGVELGTHLVDYAGLADVFTRRDIRSPADLRIEIGGKTVGERRLGVDDGWVRLEVNTEEAAAAEVRFVIGAKQPRRLVCFAAEARR